MPSPPSATDFEVPARYYARAAEVLMRQGVDVMRVLKVARISLDRLNHPDATLRLGQVETMLSEVAQLTGRSDLAIDVGKVLKLSSHSLVGYGMLTSPNADYALRLVSRFFRLVMPTFRMRYRANAQQAELLFQPTVTMSALCFQFHIEAVGIAAHSEVRELLDGRVPDYDVYYSIAQPAHVGRYAEFPEMRCHFGWETTPGLRMKMATDLAARPLAMSDPNSLKMAETRCAALVRSAVDQGTVSDWVIMMLRESAEGMPTIVELAHTLNLSPRTLDRYLLREGVRFRELSGKIRHERACTLLKGGEQTVSQIAYELGYTDAANFTRAFRREAGVSPSQYQRATTGDAASAPVRRR
ncbi:MAG TPA: AraC family transcriptional regulator ligand-binding domain-containing protein [Fontimonas sp.]